jgi:hypothetical protein
MNDDAEQFLIEAIARAAISAAISRVWHGIAAAIERRRKRPRC